jgi:diguanylate cyclase (GGDEF)-like protein/PAS domain S-box-containing protein
MTKEATLSTTIDLKVASMVRGKGADYYVGLIAKYGSDAVVILDAKGQVEWVNRAFELQCGYELKDLAGLEMNSVIKGPESNDVAMKALFRATQRGEPFRAEFLRYHKKGHAYWIELNITPIFDDNGKLTQFMLVDRDISERKALEEERERVATRDQARKTERKNLAKTTEWLYSARTLEDLYSIVGTCVPKLIPNINGALYIYSNSRDVLDVAVEWGDKRSPSYIEPDDCWALRRGRSYHFGREEIEFPCAHKTHDTTGSFCLPLVGHGETIGMMWFEAEATRNSSDEDCAIPLAEYWELALMLAEQISLTIANVRLRLELQDRSIKDPLTELWNRRYFNETMRKARSRADDRGETVSLISIDIDHFKRFNDHHGHDAGDIVLRQVGEVLKTCVRNVDTACRIGGEEFSIICPDASPEDATALADSLRKMVADISVVYQGQTLPEINISAGIAAYPEDATDLDTLSRRSDEALYRAKSTGRNKSVTFGSMSQVKD